tara:strand:+ start:239 stop:898 length:660 start_codon:yes stop_codon:yes gene_type:complete
MKKLLLFVLSLLFIVGCSSPEPINYETKLIEKYGVYYTKDTNKPYNGRVFTINNNGEKKEGNIKEGKINGHWTTYNSSGEIINFINYNNFKKLSSLNIEKEVNTLTNWYINENIKSINKYDKKEGTKYEENYKNGNKKLIETYIKGYGSKKVGLWTTWSPDTKDSSEIRYKDGKKWNGLETRWYENGQKKSEANYKNGEKISIKQWNEDGSTKESLIKL